MEPRAKMWALTALAVVGLTVTGLVLIDRRCRHDFETLAREHVPSGGHDSALVTEADLATLPEAAARYLRKAGALGHPRVRSAHVLHGGNLRPGTRRPFMPIQGEYTYGVEPPAFFWYGKLSLAPGLSLVALDAYEKGHGTRRVKALSLLTIADDHSHELDVSAFARCAAELSLLPSFLLEKERVRFLESGSESVRYRVTDGGLSTSVELFLHPDGAFNRVEVARYHENRDGKTALERYALRGSNPKQFGWLTLPAKLDGYWNLPEGELHDLAIVIQSVDLN